jgi:hypothetical protein
VEYFCAAAAANETFYAKWNKCVSSLHASSRGLAAASARPQYPSTRGPVCMYRGVLVLGGAGVCVWSEKGGPTGILRPDQTAHACNMSQYPPVYHKFYGAARHVTRRKTLLHSSLLSLSSPCGPSLARSSLGQRQILTAAAWRCQQQFTEQVVCCSHLSDCFMEMRLRLPRVQIDNKY